MAKIVVTGGAGFIGSHIADFAQNEGHEVHVIDNLLTGRIENLESFCDSITFHEIDLRDIDKVKAAFEGADYVFHQAALPSVPRSVEHPDESNDHNVNATLNVLIAAKDCEVKRVVYAASSSAYGEQEGAFKIETMLPCPISPYGVTKLVGEHYCQAFYHTYGLETVCLRYFNVFGPRQNPFSAYTGVMAIFIPLMLKGQRPTIYGNGSQTRDFTFIQNNVHANMLAMTAEAAPGEVFNIACGENQTVLQIVETINKILGTQIEPIFAEARTGDIKHSCASVEKAKTLLGYTPLVSFEEGVARTIEWYKKELGL
ncbi:MAG: SDR family oxidoreductase [bacterium]|jgi:nucleoside-diphosphate-sugar epimerase|nr:SDR family oxidoreductase [bacterium]